MNNIKVFRERNSFTQVDIAEKLQIDKSTVSKWETGESMPRAEKLIQLAKILNCTVDDLLREETWEGA